MKKMLFMILCAGALVASTWAVDVKNKNNEKIFDITKSGIPNAAKNYFNNIRAYYLTGFDFDNYKLGDPGIDTLVKAEVQATKNGVGKTSSIADRVTPAGNSYYSIIGHSQGGLRALGYLSELKRKRPAEIKNIDAIVTISGADQGIKALDGGIAGFRARAAEKVNIAGNGLRSIIGLSDFLGPLQQFIIPRNGLAVAFTFVLHFIPSDMRSFWMAAWLEPNNPNHRQLHDMVPKSPYIKANVVNTVEHRYKVRTGQQLTAEWRSTKVLFITVYYLWIGYVDTYSYYTASEAIPQFDSSVPVGFIAGLNSKTLDMAGDPNIRVILNVVGGVFAGVQIFHIARCFTLVGLFDGSLIYAADAGRARDLMWNFEGELNDIKRSKQNDGLVALESQYIPKTFKDPNTGATRTNLRNHVLGKNAAGYVGMPNYNHKNIVEKSDTFLRAADMIMEGKKIRGR